MDIERIVLISKEPFELVKVITLCGHEGQSDYYEILNNKQHYTYIYPNSDTDAIKQFKEILKTKFNIIV